MIRLDFVKQTIFYILYDQLATSADPDQIVMMR